MVEAAVPDRSASAGERATHDLLDGLIALGHQVTFTTLGRQGEESQWVSSLRSRGVIVPDGYGTGVDHLRRVVAERDWDVVIAHRPGPALVASEVVRGGSAATIYFGHDIHQWRLTAQSSLMGEVPSHLLAVTTVAEKRCWEAFDLSVYPTDREAAHVSDVSGSQDAGWSFPYYRLGSADLPAPATGDEGRNGLLMVGGSAHAPNRDAVSYAVQEVLPLTGDRLTVVGDWPQVHRAGLESPTVRFVGRLTDQDLIDLHSRHVALLAPLRFGAGSRRKLVAAMGLGLPVITTPEGSRGLLVRDAAEGDGVLFAEVPSRMAGMVRMLRTDPLEARELATRARQAAASIYSADVYDARLAELLDAAVRRSRQRLVLAHQEHP